MPLNNLPRQLILLLTFALLMSGLALSGWGVVQLSSSPSRAASTPIVDPGGNLDQPSPQDDANALVTTVQPATPLATPTTDPRLQPASVFIANGVPHEVRQRIARSILVQSGDILTTTNAATATIVLDPNPANGRLVYEQVFAATARFDTIDPTITWANLRSIWQGSGAPFAAAVVLSDTLPTLQQILGAPGPTVRGVATVEQAATFARDATPTLIILPFDLLVPKLVVLAIDGQNPVENASRFEAATYPLTARIYAHTHEVTPGQRPAVRNLLLHLPRPNRDPQRLTVIAMTGVTAMVRLTAAGMDQRGNGWPAEVVGPELAAADITHISNEVPFVPGCQTNTSSNNLTFCSKPEYMETLSASGVDIIGLTGNHQNDYGREDALTSLQIYADAGLPVYGGGVNKEAAEAPLYIVHNGNRLAFLGANSYGPDFAWATDDLPGSARFDVDAMSSLIRTIKAQRKADVVLAELQYQETYVVSPLLDQRQNFNALVEAGADIVTGVQSHVPQALEFTDGHLILYGLGNLYFDQMWSQETRDGLIVKHTIYKGRHISTQVLTTLLHDYGQPRWTSPEDRARILRRVFAASYWE